MADLGITVADALVTALAAHEFTATISVARKWDPYQKLHDQALKTPVVWLVPKGGSDSRSAADFPPSRQRDLTIYLIFQQTVDASDDTALDTLNALCDAVYTEAIAAARGGASWQSSSDDGHNFADLHESNLYRREYAMTWRAWS